jgi:hypothetical protein
MPGCIPQPRDGLVIHRLFCLPRLVPKRNTCATLLFSGTRVRCSRADKRKVKLSGHDSPARGQKCANTGLKSYSFLRH